MAKIAVEPSLTDVKQLLQQNGHEVVGIDQATNCSCCVITGQDINVMGMANTSTNASVINADGKTARQVVDQVLQSIK
ncbi:YkuS family protein [Gorillibacterium sp. sgz5001074]|uniref:YkuS family protein n=1 Tax=Gorillibacterium sp. sgz5001074 TaxID=3446695 RepID=UPI003F673890